jgi:short-subunit dehydrogenase
MQRFLNQVVIVTGASAGIGKATAYAFAQEGAIVVLVARREDRLRRIAEEIRQRGGRAMDVAMDVADRDQTFGMVHRVIAELGRVDILVNNAGIGLISPVVDMQSAELERVMDVNFYGLIWCTQAVLPHMIQRQSGQIINVSSVVGKRAVPRMSAYCASKFAVQAFSESLRMEVAPHHIDVVVICPPRTETEFDRTPMMDRPGSRVKLDGIPAEAIASAILKAAKKRKREVIVTWRGKAFSWAGILAPRLLDWMMERIWARLGEQPDGVSKG